MATITKVGHGQVEPNHLSAQRTGQIYAQLPAASAIKTLDNGMFVKYDYANGEVNYTGEGEFLLVYCEEKLYDELRQTRKDFYLDAAEAVDSKIYPRCFKTNVQDIFTTNMVKEEEIIKGDTLVVGATGVLEKGTATAGEMAWFVVEVTTMPDGQAGLKLQRIA